MTELELAAHRVLMASFSGPTVPDWLHRRLDAGLGSVCLFGSNLTGEGDGPDGHVAAVTEQLLKRSPRLVVAIDEEGGDVTRFDARTGSRVPGALALGTADDVALTRRVHSATGARLRAAGIGLNLAPVADVNVDAANPIVGVRSFGADAALVAAHVAAAVDGLQQGAGVAACVKHFPGHGGTREDSHTDLPRLAISGELLRERELLPFRAAIGAGVHAVMLGHLVVPAIDDAGPASTSAACVRLLREELGFRGAIVTDALDMAGVSVPHDGVPGAAVAALAAGCDLLCLGSEFTDEGVGAVVDAILAAVRDGALRENRLLEAAATVDALGDVIAAAPAADAATEDPEAAREAALAAVSVSGTIPPLDLAVVADLDVPPTIAAGPVRWGLGGPLAARLPGVDAVRLGPDESPDGLLDLAAGRPLVLTVRDAHRHPWVARALAAVAAERTDTIVVETGWPGPDPLPGAVVLHTRGASAASLAAAADLLAGTRASAP